MGTLLKGVGSFSSEHEFWSIPRVNLDENAVIGIAQPDSPLDAAVGEDANSYGFVLGTGELKNDGDVITTLDIVNEPTDSVLRSVISLIVILDSSPRMILAIDGSWHYQLDLPDDKFWTFAATVAGGNAGETSLFSNFGQRGFNYPILWIP
jgi:hypothetical protein